MTVLVDTADVAPHERFALWAEVSAEVFEPLRVRALEQQPFSARLQRYRLGPLNVDHMAVDASRATRTLGLIHRQDPEEVKLMLQLRGECMIAQDDRAATTRPGEFTSWQSSRPYTVAGQRPFEVLVVHCQSSLLRPHLDRICRRTAQRIEGGSRIATVVRHYLTELIAGLEEDAFEAGRRGHLAEGVLDLIQALCVPPDAPDRPAARRSDGLRARINAYIDAHLSDSELRPEGIAREHFVSRSYLNKLFEAQGAGVRETIRTKRLERSRCDLADPTLADEPIFEIASRWGFRSASHFSRSFRAAYRQSPREFRREMARPD